MKPLSAESTTTVDSSLLMEQVRRIAADVFSVAVTGLEPTSSPDTVETWDSLNHLSLVLALEQELQLQFTPEEMEELLSIELIVGLVEEKRMNVGGGQ